MGRACDRRHRQRLTSTSSETKEWGLRSEVDVYFFSFSTTSSNESRNLKASLEVGRSLGPKTCHGEEAKWTSRKKNGKPRKSVFHGSPSVGWPRSELHSVAVAPRNNQEPPTAPATWPKVLL